MLARTVPLLLALCACGGATRDARTVAAKRSRPNGALMLAHPGNGPAFAVGALDVVRGRVRYHLDADGGATRARDVLAEPITQALALPPSLGGGVALIGEQGVAIAAPVLTPLVRASLTSVSVGAGVLWARDRYTFDWVRIDLARGRATREPPPIAAPILTNWSTIGASAGKAMNAGPEFASPAFAVAIVDLLGPVLSRDGGASWSPLDPAVIRAAFPFNPPNRVVRDGATLMLGSDDRSVPVLSSGALGAPITAGPIASIADAAAIRVEHAAPYGVPLPNGDVLIADGGRFSVLEVDTVRVARATRAPDLGRCDLVADRTLALAACLRHQEGSGGHLAIGTITDEHNPRFTVDRSFPYGTSYHFSSTAAVVVAASCAGTSEGGIDLSTASKVCVRDATGSWSELTLPVHARRHVIPRAGGGVLYVREDGAGRLEVVAVTGSTRTTMKLDMSPRELLAIDETAPGRFTLWRRGTTDLRAVTLQVSTFEIAVVDEGRRTLVDANALVGVHGTRAMIVAVSPKARVEASISSDSGRTWSLDAWPDDVKPLDLTASGRRLECGAAGCRALGWTRVGWQPTVTSHDRIVTLEDAPPMAAPPPPVTRSKAMRARCTSSGTQSVAASSVPLATPSYPAQHNDVLLGLPAPKLPKDHVQVLTPFSALRHVRGGYITVGPMNGPWGDKARTFARFASDLDPLGTVHETPPFPSPFPDRLQAQLTWGRPISAIALGPGRVLIASCTYGRCDVHRLIHSAAPERIDLGDVAMARFVNARELGDTLAIFGTGNRRDPAGTARWLEPLPFVALIDARGTTISFLGRAGFSDDPYASLTVDVTRGVFGVRSSTKVPTWTEGAAYVLKLGGDGRPAGPFEALLASSAEVSRPTKPCGPSVPGWDEADISGARSLQLVIDGAAPITMEALAGALRSRVTPSAVCLDRFTALSRSAAFQLDAPAGRAAYMTLDADGKAGKRTDLTCALEWL